MHFLNQILQKSEVFSLLLQLKQFLVLHSFLQNYCC
nr:MAG TPA: hypothetical protein [Caudoviricetes sp.]